MLANTVAMVLVLVVAEKPSGKSDDDDEDDEEDDNDDDGREEEEMMMTRDGDDEEEADEDGDDNGNNNDDADSRPGAVVRSRREANAESTIELPGRFVLCGKTAEATSSRPTRVTGAMDVNLDDDDDDDDRAAVTGAVGRTPVGRTKDESTRKEVCGKTSEVSAGRCAISAAVPTEEINGEEEEEEDDNDDDDGDDDDDDDDAE
jgi:hypothetical protein